MNKIEIEVPRDIRYISDWKEFPLQQLSTGHCIVNKTITGCGYTHFCLTNNIPIILCSPRKFLLENKYKQLHKKYNIYLVINKGEKSLDVDSNDDNNSSIKSSSLIKPTKIKSQELEKEEEREKLSIITTLKQELSNYIINCTITGQVPKILVTYDSLKYVLEVIKKEHLSLYSVIVDEFQNIFMDSRFKSNTELSFISYLQDCPNVTYLSATPYIEEYLEELDEFKDLPYYELCWDYSRIQRIKIDPRKSLRPNQDIDQIIQDYLESRFPEKVDEFGVHQSKEVVFYVNSVKMICSIIKRNSLTEDQVNIICADTDKNRGTLKKIKLTIGTAPLEGEPHKMFTFCTRTTYAGADFYSTCALSVIISDCKIDSLATDIRMDFPQIMGRQRLKENVFRDECIFIYKLSDETITMEEYNKISEEKMKMTMQDILNYDSLLKTQGTFGANRLISDFRLRINAKKYSEDYTGINERTGEPAINKLVLISEKRAFELRSNVYKNDVLVYNEFEAISSEMDINFALEKVNVLNQLRESYRTNGAFEDKMKEICLVLLDPKWNGYIHISDLFWIKLTQRNYLYILGPERIKEIGYKEADIKREIFNIHCSDLIKENFIKIITIKKRYSLKDLKEMIQQLYTSLNITKTPKATDILEYFNVKEVTLYDPETKKKARGYEIISLK